MLRLALKMLYGDVAKFVMLLGGLTFCALLMTQQSGVFCGLMRWTTSTLRNIKVPIWVCDAKVEQVNEVVPLRDIEVNRVRSVEGVEWAVPLYWGIIICDEPTAALDAATARKVLELLKASACRSDRSVIVVTHDSRIFDFADRIAEMEDGIVRRIHTAGEYKAHYV